MGKGSRLCNLSTSSGSDIRVELICVWNPINANTSRVGRMACMCRTFRKASAACCYTQTTTSRRHTACCMQAGMRPTVVVNAARAGCIPLPTLLVNADNMVRDALPASWLVLISAVPVCCSHWLPGYDTPEHLDGSMPGDFGENR